MVLLTVIGCGAEVVAEVTEFFVVGLFTSQTTPPHLMDLGVLLCVPFIKEFGDERVRAEREKLGDLGSNFIQTRNHLDHPWQEHHLTIGPSRL